MQHTDMKHLFNAEDTEIADVPDPIIEAVAAGLSPAEFPMPGTPDSVVAHKIVRVVYEATVDHLRRNPIGD